MLVLKISPRKIPIIKNSCHIFIQINKHRIYFIKYFKVESKIIKDIVNTNSPTTTSPNNSIMKSTNPQNGQKTGEKGDELAKSGGTNCLSNCPEPVWNTNDYTTNHNKKTHLYNSNLETPYFHLQAESSCSTTPNSQYSKNIIVNTFNTPKYNTPNQILASSYMPIKLDNDIGSASGK